MNQIDIDVNRYEYLRNDIHHLWLKHPGLTTIEVIDLLRKRRKITRPGKGIKEFIDEARKKFETINFVEDPFQSLPKDDTPIGSNPFMSKW